MRQFSDALHRPQLILQAFGIDMTTHSWLTDIEYKKLVEVDPNKSTTLAKKKAASSSSESLKSFFLSSSDYNRFGSLMKQQLPKGCDHSIWYANKFWVGISKSSSYWAHRRQREQGKLRRSWWKGLYILTTHHTIGYSLHFRSRRPHFISN